MNFKINLFEADWESILFTDTLQNSTVTQYDRYYNTLMLENWLIINCRETLLHAVDDVGKMVKFSECRVQI